MSAQVSPRWRLIAALTLCFGVVLPGGAVDGKVHQSDEHAFRTVVVAQGLDHPWSVAFLPDGDFLVTERSGNLKRVSVDGKLVNVDGVPDSANYGQGGLLEVSLHPQFDENRYIYLTLSGTGQGGVGTEVVRARLEADRLIESRVIFRAVPKVSGGRHFGSRIVWMDDGTMLVSLGDRGHRARAQHMSDHIGTIVRIRPDGEIPDDNPFVGRNDVRPEIYSYGHRNVQGLTRDAKSGRVWGMEHGPQGGDEVNLIEPGVNYGWPVITYGVNYGVGTKIGKGTSRDGMAQPAHQWTPSIAPSGLAFYDGDKFPKWRGNLFAGALKYRLVARLKLDGDKIVSEERLLQGEFGRIRDVRVGPDGYIYLLSDAGNGKLIRVEPAN